MKIAILGASGRTGQSVTRLALAAGHSVRALARNRSKLAVAHERLEVIAGDATDAAAVTGLVSGCDAVISALGPSAETTNVCSTATRHVIAAGARRYVVVSGAGLDVEGDQKDLIGKVVSWLVRVLSPAVFADKVAEFDLLKNSQIPFVAVRPPRLVDTPAAGAPRVSLQRAQGSSVSREDLAAFLLECLSDDAYLRRAPFIAGKA